MSLWDTISEQLHTNAFLSGGMVLMTLGAIGAWCRRVPGRVWHWCVRKLFIEFEITQRDPAFWVFNEWLSKQPYSQHRARNLSVKSQRPDDPDEPIKIILSPAPGVHWLFWKGHFLIVHRERKETQGPSSTPGFDPEKEIFNVSVLARKQAIVHQILHDAFEVTKPPADDPRMSVFVPDYNGWYESKKIRHRPWESVVLRRGMADRLVAIIDEFRKSEEWYVSRGLPWRLGILLYGPPGNGKTSTSAALASKLNLDLAILSLGSSTLNDSTLRDLIADVPKNSLLLVEDVDCVFHQREATHDKDNNRVTFSGLLNAIDGVMAAEGRVLIMTTNHKDKLDPALIRPGRADHHIFIDNADEEQAAELWKRFFPGQPGAEQFGTAQSGQSMAAIQNLLIEHRDDPQGVLCHLTERRGPVSETNCSS